MSQTFARVVDGVVQEVIALPDGLKLDECFTPEIVAQCVTCPADVSQRSTYANGTFTPPPAWP